MLITFISLFFPLTDILMHGHPVSIDYTLSRLLST